MTSFQAIVEGIKALKIQGASNIAKGAAKALDIIASDYKDRNKPDLIHVLNEAKKILVKTRPTEPAMRNVLNYILFDIEIEKDVVDAVKQRVKKANEHFDESSEKIALIGEKKILNKGIVFTHCHSSTVVAVLKKAKEKGKNFVVHNTETRPLFQGRITARELSRVGIPVVHYIDSAARLALKKADLMLLGADAITSEGKVINKIGSELFAEVADRYGVPVYICTDSWKFDPRSIFGYEEEIEQRTGEEIWPVAPKGVKIDNHAFEKIDPDLVSGIVSELGVLRHDQFIREVEKTYRFMFEKEKI